MEVEAGKAELAAVRAGPLATFDSMTSNKVFQPIAASFPCETVAATLLASGWRMKLLLLLLIARFQEWLKT